MHFSPTKKTEFGSDWLFQVSLLVVRNWVRPTFRDPETFMKTTVLYILKDRNDAGWSPTDHCMYSMSFFGILWVVLILFTQMVTQPLSQGPPLHGDRVGEDPGNEVPGYFVHFGPPPVCLVGNHGVIGRSPCNLHPFPVSFWKVRERVKQNNQKENKQTNKQNPRVSISLLGKRIRNMRREINRRKEVASSFLPRILLPSYRTLEQALAFVTGTMKMKGAR